MHSVDCKYVICSVEKFLHLVGGKCPEVGYRSPVDIDYSLSGCCLTMVGCCGNGHVLDWVSLDFHTNKKGSRIFNINVYLHVQLFCLVTALLK